MLGALVTSDGTSRDPFSYRRERVDETLSRPDEICLLNKNETLSQRQSVDTKELSLHTCVLFKNLLIALAIITTGFKVLLCIAIVLPS